MEDLIFKRPVLFEKGSLKGTEDDADSKLIKKAVNRIASDHGFQNFKICLTNLSFGGASFLSTLCTIDIVDLETEKEINLLFKNMPEIECLFNVRANFERESFFYNDLAIKFDDIQNEFNLPEMERYRLVKSYKSETNTMIIMENLQRHGYESPDRMEVPSLDFIKKSINELAKFKALSIALEKHRPIYFEKIVKALDFLLKPDERFIQNTTMLLEEDLDLHKNEKVRNKLAKRIPTMYKQFIELFSSRNATCGLTHNDYRPSNTLIKLEDGKIMDYINIDYQFLGYTNIINDFILLIFSSTDREFRKKHLEYIKNYFHDNIAKYLNYYNIAIDDVYPKEVFEKEYREKLQLGLIGALVALPILLALPDDLPDFSKPLDEWRINKRSPECVRRFNDIGEEFLDWGIL